MLTGVVKSLRVIGAFVLNVFVATVVTNALGSSFFRLLFGAGSSGPVQMMIEREYLVSAMAAFGMGYFVYRRWQPTAAKWVWLAGVLWFSWGAAAFWRTHRASNSTAGCIIVPRFAA